MQTYIVFVPVDGAIEIRPFDKENSLKQLQGCVGGLIEPVPLQKIPTNHPYSIECYVDEEGLVRAPQRKTNTRLSYYTRMLLVGDAVFVGLDSDGETVGLEEDDALKLKSDLS